MNTRLTTPTNKQITKALRRIARLLESQKANPDRARAYLEAARRIEHLEVPAVVVLASSGRKGLAHIPEIGPSIAAEVEEFAYRRRIALLDLLDGRVSAEEVLASVPGLGEKRAAIAHEALGIDTLEELELAAVDGRLATVRGFGKKRIEGLLERLDAILSHSPRRRSRVPDVMAEGAAPAPVPPVKLVLKIDTDYRTKVDAGGLPLMAPRRLNPDDTMFLPILHTERDGWTFMAMYAHSGRAQKAGKTRDWVVIIAGQKGLERQYTVITEEEGALAGNRIIRGREVECGAHYDGGEEAPPETMSNESPSSGTTEIQA